MGILFFDSSLGDGGFCVLAGDRDKKGCTMAASFGTHKYVLEIKLELSPFAERQYHSSR